MAKKLKINIKNEQLQKALKLGGLKDKLKKNEPKKDAKVKKPAKKVKEVEEEVVEEVKEEHPRIRARSKSAFAEKKEEEAVTPHEPVEQVEEVVILEEEVFSEPEETPIVEEKPTAEKTEQPSKEIKEEVVVEKPIVEEIKPAPLPAKKEPLSKPKPFERLGPTGRHINDILPVKKPKPKAKPETPAGKKTERTEKKPATKEATTSGQTQQDKFQNKPSKVKEYRDLKPTKQQNVRSFDSRDRQGLRRGDEDQRWRKRRQYKTHRAAAPIEVIRPSTLTVRLPISLKDLAQEMKLKSSQLIEKLFLQGMIVNINTMLDDETTVQLLGSEFQCAITIDTTEEERIRITDKSITEEINESDESQLEARPPIVTFMGHVDHGKTSLIDHIRASNRTSSEAGDITQHIGAFRCSTDVGDIAILDTPGHEAFSAMRARGANVTDIVVLVIAGDEGIRAQTTEAIQHAKAAGVSILVAVNKCDKPNFNPDNVYRQLSEQELLPEAWGGQTITINCSAVTGEGVKELLEMLALQAEVMELRANPNVRARGTVLESQLHKGLGTVATVLVQNGTLRKGDALVFEEYSARVKTMRDEYGTDLEIVGPSTPVEITGLSGLPSSGQEFIAVESEKEAREISSVRQEGIRQKRFKVHQAVTLESLLQDKADMDKKALNVIIRGDVQGSVEALKVALMKIESDKVELNIIFNGVGEVSESDVQLAIASKAVIIGFHTQVESHADQLIKQHTVQVHLYDIIYHAIDGVKEMMSGLLDKVAQENDVGAAEVQATFKSSHLGVIAGCLVTEGSIERKNQVRVMREGEQVWKGPIASIRRVKEDVRDVQKGVECGIVLNGFNTFEEGDIIQAFEITYITQELQG